MKSISFNRPVFQRTMRMYIVATLVMLVLSVLLRLISVFSEMFVSVVLFLVLPVSLVWGMGKFRPVTLLLIPVAVALFLFNSFGLPGIVMSLTHVRWVYPLAASLLTATVFTLLVNRWHRVEFRWQTILGTTVGMALAYALQDSGVLLRADLGMFDNFSVFLIFHTLIILPLALGMAAGKKEIKAG
ncbi:hypothetical protein [Chitinophaga rhizosphaerae]|uniref:hypothetical protein n=1 Tax=Chitinophaga rhizosphaerae TaxID=1864947 RepID=UPI000F80BCBF|nr:hypothetical protein [Chitinophaga rhizosphaerae]